MEGFRDARQRAVDRASQWTALGVWNGSSVVGDIVNYIRPGYGQSERVGREIALDEIDITASFSLSWSLSAPGVFVRFVVIYDRAPIVNSGVNIIPSWNDVFAGMDLTGGANNSPFEGPNVANAERFVILVDDQFTMNGEAVSYGGTYRLCGNREVREYSVNLSGLLSSYGKENGVSTEYIEEGAIYVGVVRVVDSGLGGTGFNLDVLSRTRLYYDEL